MSHVLGIGEEFVARVREAAKLMTNGKGRVSPFVALTSTLDNEDWVVLYGAALRMAMDIEAGNDNMAKNLGKTEELHSIRQAILKQIEEAEEA